MLYSESSSYTAVIFYLKCLEQTDYIISCLQLVKTCFK